MKTLEERVVSWVQNPARWYQFWLPQSGLLGGLIGAALFLLPIGIYVYFC